MNDEDLDRLADYTAGLLDPAQETELDRLIATDPAWARAFADLTAAGPRLDADLAALGDAPIPSEVAERLAAVLALQSPPEGTRTTNVVDLSARRRWARRAAGLTAAAAVIASIFGGVTVLANLANRTQTGSATGLSAGSAGQDSAVAGPVIRNSGTDYDAVTLRALGANAAQFSGSRPGSPGSRSTGKYAPAPASAPGQPPLDTQPLSSAQGLSRLLDAQALQGCLTAIMARYGGQPVLVDYARYLGSPAVVVVLDTGGTRRIVVVGPRCGAPGAGPDERYSIVE
jgi:hypothetical protein